MRFRNSTERYGAAPMFFHWLTAFLVVVAWTLGIFGDDIPRGEWRDLARFVHVSAGLLVIVLLLARFAWRIIDPPPLGETTPFGPWADYAGRMAHYALYALLAAVPIVGIVALFGEGKSLPIFSLFEIPSPWPKDRIFSEQTEGIHETLANVLLALAALHTIAALTHHWVFRDRTLTRMLPSGGGAAKTLQAPCLSTASSPLPPISL
jgi:cytochrome b561